jgi:riboflavin-specific deaminase-like protein
LTHQLRSLHDGILVGIGTVLSDDPLLNVRCWSGPDPQPMVLDSQARFPAAARLSNLDAKRCWVLTTAAPHTVEDTDADTDSGPEYLSLPADANGRVALDAALQMLWQRGIRSLMVEGGGSVITAFLQARLADAVILTIAPTMVGGYRAVSDLGFTCKQQLPQIAPLHTARLGEDLIMWGQLQFGDVTP